ncbi:MAG: PD40 domain-containing protein [Ignavibacteria bacterium]|nr:PD40 domain-containing protein [Ignavibacteria bacterium]
MEVIENIGFVWLCTVLYCILFTQNAFSQDVLVSTLWENPVGGHTVKSFNSSKNVWEPLYTNKEYSFFEYVVTVSPKNKYIALIGSTSGFVRTSEGAEYEKRKMFIIGKNGKEIFSQDSVWRFSWSPDGEKIAWISGILREGAEQPAPLGVYVYNVRTRTKKFVGASNDVELYWATFDSLLYTETEGGPAGVVAYNPTTGERMLTNYYGVHFSPDGKYYFSTEEGGLLYKLFDRASNKEVTLKGFEKGALNHTAAWVKGEPSLLMLGDMFKEKKVVDIKRGKVIGTVDGYVLSYQKDKRQFITHTNGKISKKRLEIE